jgi:hypothetical protein
LVTPGPLMDVSPSAPPQSPHHGPLLRSGWQIIRSAISSAARFDMQTISIVSAGPMITAGIGKIFANRTGVPGNLSF